MDWEIYDGLKQHGPMPEAEVYEVIRAGLPRNAYVRQRGASDWVPIDKHPAFATALQQRGAAGQWPPPGTPYAVSSPYAGQATRRQLSAGGCFVQALGVVLLLGAGLAPYAGADLVVPAVAALAALGLGLVLLLVGGLLNLKWVCGQCKQPVAGRSVHLCPNCRASFT
jgi:hypothetical protein